jgi:hypothetical protein
MLLSCATITLSLLGLAPNYVALLGVMAFVSFFEIGIVTLSCEYSIICEQHIRSHGLVRGIHAVLCLMLSACMLASHDVTLYALALNLCSLLCQHLCRGSLCTLLCLRTADSLLHITPLTEHY